MKLFTAIKGATMYEMQIWRFYIGIPFWRFLRAGCPVRFGYDRSDEE